MKEVLSWIVEHYELIILVGACLLDIVLFLFGVFKKKKEPIMACIYAALPHFIEIGEASGLKGHEKLLSVLGMVSDFYKKVTGFDDLPSGFLDDIRLQIELILSTPQKKGK